MAGKGEEVKYKAFVLSEHILMVMFGILRVEQNTLSTTGLTQLYNGQMPFCGKNQFLDDP